MAYIPKNKYKVLETNGLEYKFINSGKPYKGKYLKLNNGKTYAGADPNNITGELTPIAPPLARNIVNAPNNNIYYSLNRKQSEKQGSYLPINKHIPIPTPIDYSKGFFNRYIDVKLNNYTYTEISPDTYNNFSRRNYDKVLYKVGFLEWSLGENNELNNTKTLRQLEYSLKGIFEFFPDKSQFGLKQGVINLNPTTRIYPNGETISKSLPAAYQVGNQQVNTIDNPRVPDYQYCGNCIFNQNGYCTRWKANIKNNYWCAVWQGLGSQE